MSADRTPGFVALERRVTDLELAVRILLGRQDFVEGEDEYMTMDATPAERAAVTLVNSRGFQQRHRDLFLGEGTPNA